VNKRFIIVGIIFGILIGVAVYIGSPMFLGFDLQR